MKGFGFLAFVALTIVCWGVYGPVLHEGQSGMGVDGARSLLKPIVGVGLAYFLIAVLFPFFMLSSKGEPGGWTTGGFFWSFVAGAIGALGAVGIALANKFGGSPIYVMPLVFGFAPVVNTLVTMVMSKSLRDASPLFYIGVAIVAIGGAGVLVFKPSVTETGSPASHASDTRAGGESSLDHSIPLIRPVVWMQQEVGESGQAAANDKTATENPLNDQPAVQQPAPSASAPSPAPANSQRNLPMIIASIALTALCWGAYGPVLHRGQMKMAGSRLRPFLCVGLAYFVLAVIAPVLLLGRFPEPGGWWNVGLFWSILAGAAGAFGALGIIYAFNFGGRPIFVMPLVFGGAPVVNTLSQALAAGGDLKVPPAFYLSLFLVIIGAIMVLVTAPRGHAKPVVPKPA